MRICGGTLAAILVAVVVSVAVHSLTQKIRPQAPQVRQQADSTLQLPFLGLKRAFLMGSGQAVPVGSPLRSELRQLSPLRIGRRSNAEITKGCIEWSVTEKLPPVPKYKNIVPYAPGIAVIHRADIPLDVPHKIKLTPIEIGEIDSGQKNFWVFGFIGFQGFPR